MVSEKTEASQNFAKELAGLLEAGKPAAAAEKAEEILRRHPRVFDALHLGAVANAQSGKPHEAIAMFHAALEIRGDVPDLHNNLGNTYRQLGRIDEAIKSYRQALDERPNFIEAQGNLASALFTAEHYDEAIDSYRKILREQPNTLDALLGFGIACLEVKRPEGAVTALERAVKLKPESHEFHNRLGAAYDMLGWNDEAIKRYQRAIKLRPDFAAAHDNLGAAYLAVEKLREAKQCFDRAIELDPQYFDAHRHLGETFLKATGFSAAVKAFRGAIDLRSDHAETHAKLGIVYFRLKQYDAAIECSRRALEIDPGNVEANRILGLTYSELNQHGKAIALLRGAIRLNPLDHLAHHDLGMAHYAAKHNREAMVHYKRSVELEPDCFDAHCNIALAYHALGRQRAALDSFKRAHEISPDSAFAHGWYAGTKRGACEWADMAETEQALIDAARKPSAVVAPFTLMDFSDDPADLLNCSAKYGKQKLGSIAPLEALSPNEEGGEIRVAYLSADFHQHATAYLMAELFERHNKDRFEIHAVSFGPSNPNPMRERLQAAFDGWHEIGSLGDREAAELIRSLGIHIAVDLKGYTRDCRPTIMAYRPAPIQVNYLGYPGSMGTPCIDYILVDKFIVPRTQQKNFTEKLVHLPNCYQVNDRNREIGDETPTRADLGLPEDGFVFCCFNNTRKLTPVMFDIWMRLLARVDGSVLWLFKGNPLATGNLRDEAEKRGVDPDRLVFASGKPLAEHLARYRQADLFLDTLPYNAHTTASDALWVGLPLVTCAGTSFAARVAGSILKAAGMPELVTNSLDDYEALALRLATEPDFLAACRKKLAKNRDTAPLFDCARFTRNLETAYETMSARWRSGKPPKAFAVEE
jgi:predicted O-linked N-acetylglucosamine transferase (SPINDLY family)